MMHKILDYLTKVIGWLQIVASPLLFGLGIGAIIFFSKSDHYKAHNWNFNCNFRACYGYFFSHKNLEDKRRDNRVYVKNFSNSRT